MTAKRIISWSGGVVAGISAIIWMNTTFLTKAEFYSHSALTKEWLNQSIDPIKKEIKTIQDDINGLQIDNKMILRKLDVLEVRILTITEKKTANVH